MKRRGEGVGVVILRPGRRDWADGRVAGQGGWGEGSGAGESGV